MSNTYLLYFNKSIIKYRFINIDNFEQIMFNYLSIYELRINSARFFQQNLILIEYISTISNFRNQKNASNALRYFINTIKNNKPIILFCENNYSFFDLVSWYEKMGFIKIYENLESSLLLLE